MYDRFKKIKSRYKRNKKSARILNKDIEEKQGGSENDNNDDLLNFDDSIFGLKSNVIDLTK